ncbi:response regulator [Paraflavisolibacter sp. H34]|uniref:response regulator n=1 Tax=Huijunlia imazamoxiresistens TaxID=3127457 RepID=UPI0030177A51
MSQCFSRPAHILVVDDDEDDRRFFQEAIARACPWMVVTFLGDTDHLLEALECTGPSLVFIDYKLPGENGIEGVQRMRRHPRFRALPVVMWSTGNLPAVAAAAYGAGVQHFLEKPWDLAVWTRDIIRVLEQNGITLLPRAAPELSGLQDNPRQAKRGARLSPQPLVESSIITEAQAKT